MTIPSASLNIVNLMIISNKPKRLTEISKELSISPATTYRIMVSLKNEGYVIQDQVSKKYMVGNRLLEMALTLVSHLELRNVSLPYLELLHNQLKENVMLSCRVGLERMFIEQIQCSHELRFVTELGRPLPLWTGAPGKVILAYMKKSEIEQVINNLKQQKIKSLATSQALNIDNLLKELTHIRKVGFSISKGERIIGSISVAAPIFNRDNQIVGAISTGCSAFIFTSDMAISYGPLVRSVAKKISLQLGNIQKESNK